jgi:hypothetical protein
MITKKQIPSTVAKVGVVSSTATAPKAVDDEALFVRYFGEVTGALIISRIFFDSKEEDTMPVHNYDDLLELAQWYAERMVRVVHRWCDDREVQRFEARRKED